MAAPPTLGQLGLKIPFFLRKLPRKHSWGDSSTPPDQRIDEVVRIVFLRDPKPYSLFQIATDDDLRRVTMGVNSGRDSLKEDVAYIPILPEELIAAGIPVDQSIGDTRCHLANRLHRDIPAQEAQLRTLCRTIIEANRSVLSLKRNQLVSWETQTKAEGCLAYKHSANCLVPECNPPSPDSGAVGTASPASSG